MTYPNPFSSLVRHVLWLVPQRITTTMERPHFPTHVEPRSAKAGHAGRRGRPAIRTRAFTILKIYVKLNTNTAASVHCPGNPTRVMMNVKHDAVKIAPGSWVCPVPR